MSDLAEAERDTLPPDRPLVEDFRVAMSNLLDAKFGSLQKTLATLAEETQRIGVEQREIERRLQRKEVISYAAFALGLVDAGGILVLLAQQVVR